MSYTDFDFPHSHMYESDLREVIATIRKLEEIVKNFVNTETIVFADPITWNITKQYAKGTIVLNGEGNAYLSKKPVPIGVELNNEEYWLEIFNYIDYVKSFNSNLTVNIESNTDRATSNYAVDDWLVWNDILYKVTSAISIDDLLTVDSNIERFTVEQFCRTWSIYMVNTIQQYKDDIDASELAYVAAMQAEVDRILAGATVDSEVIDARLGANGIEYSTLGNAIRKQFESVKTVFSSISEHTKNLYDPSLVINGYFTGQTPTVRINDNARMVFIPCEPSKTYTVSKTAGTRFTAGYIEEFPAEGVSVYAMQTNYSGTSITITTGANAEYLVSWVWNAPTDTITVDEMLASVQIEVGSSATSYEPPYTAIDRIFRTYGFRQIGVVQDGDDLNDYKSHIGYYLMTMNSTYSNCPAPTGNRRFLACFAQPPGNYTHQILYDTTLGIIYQRLYASGNWTDWTSTRDNLFEWINIIPNNADLDDYHGVSGWYGMQIASTFVNCPVKSGNRRMLFCYVSGVAGYTHQILYNATDGLIWQRIYTSGNWTNWKSSIADTESAILGALNTRICTSHGGVFTNSNYEDSPKAMIEARKLGIIYQDVDVVFTADGVPIVSHNSFADNAIRITDQDTSRIYFHDYTLSQLKNDYVFGDSNYIWTIQTLKECYDFNNNLGCKLCIDVGGGSNNPSGSREALCDYMIENGIKCEYLVTSELDTFTILQNNGGENFPLGIVIAAAATDSLTVAENKINAIIAAKSSLSLERAWCMVRRERMEENGDLVNKVSTLRNAGISIGGYSYNATTCLDDIPSFFESVASGVVNINYQRYLNLISNY